MGWLDLPYHDEPEEIDGLDRPPDAVSASLDDLARTNRLFGGVHTVMSRTVRLLETAPRGQTIRILDIATGAADIPRALQAWARRKGCPLEIVAVDLHPAMLAHARALPDPPTLIRADALHLPFAPGAFDLALCALAFHHLGFDASVRLLAAMDRLTTRGFVVSDLRRDRLSLAAVQAGMRLLRVHPYTRHDGPASVRRAWTPAEYRRMIARSGVRDVRLSTPWYFRVALVQDKREMGKMAP